MQRLRATGDLAGLVKAAKYKKDPAIREEARVELEKAMDRMIQLLQSKHLPHMDLAREGLVLVGPPARDRLIFILREGHVHRRQDAAFVLGMMRDPAAVPALQLALHNPDPLLRMLCVQALGKIGGDEARETLRQALADADPKVAGEARKALAALGEPR